MSKCVLAEVDRNTAPSILVYLLDESREEEFVIDRVYRFYNRGTSLSEHLRLGQRTQTIAAD